MINRRPWAWIVTLNNVELLSYSIDGSNITREYGRLISAQGAHSVLFWNAAIRSSLMRAVRIDILSGSGVLT
jgi:hypothetical protein